MRHDRTGQVSSTDIRAVMTNLVEIDRLNIRFTGERTVYAVNDLSLTLGEGEVLGLLGESGSGKSVTLKGAKELSEFLAGSEEAHDAFVEQLVHALAQQPVRAYGPATAETLRKSFVANQFNIRKLAAEIMATTALTGRTVK
jgi:ABC-type glutathione transport system ATPase component